MTQEQDDRITKLYVDMHAKLTDYAQVSMRNHALAEEAVQDTFVIACANPEKLLSSPNPEGWLMKTLHNTMRNNARTQANGRKLVEKYLLAQAKEFSFSEDRVDLKILYDNVAEMEEFRLITEMAVQGMTHQEMAKKRGITISACKKRMERAKKLLQKKIGKDVTL